MTINLEIEALLRALPENLAERSRAISETPGRPGGEFVLYWMHHAVRAHENPALDVALSLGNASRLPVVVYQGLGGQHVYNSDRHHTFILQGARETHADLRRLGVCALFHLDPGGRGSSPLRELISRAAVVICEDYPAPPFPTWTRALMADSAVAVLAVDCACIVPMRRQPRRFDRAYAFRRHNQAEYRRRVALPWPRVEPAVPAFRGRLGFAPLDLAASDIAALCASCAIDHGVPPVAHTPGGTSAGYRRWRQFLAAGLKGYRRDRNNAAIPWPRGVSRMSPYLHHGQVSPFTIVREAAQAGGDGAEKFLDELLVWREMAFNFCFHTPDPERLEALPTWAQQTLRAHADDARPLLLDKEALARSQSDDALWNLAQTSLRIHGELHNNLRMTWAKAIPHWRPDPQSSLDTLIELNHRYALDGSDPNSYGGLLWTLGLFDRPFPDSPVTGTLRSRSTKAHGRRLDVARYRARVTRPASGDPLRAAVIGGGISGLSAARALQDHGHAVVVFEKARGGGGRAATRRHDELAFDHGAQHFRARDPGFRRAVDAWQERGVVGVWPMRVGRVTNGLLQASPEQRERLVGVPGMSALSRHLATDITLRAGGKVAPPQRVADRWCLFSETGESLGEFDAVIVATPAPQAHTLLSTPAPILAAQAAKVRFQATWAALLSLEDSRRLPFNALTWENDFLIWAAENSSKPGRDGHTWVLHAAPEWSLRHLEDDPDEVARELCSRFCAVTGHDPDAIGFRAAHRWRHALVPEPLGAGALWDSNLSVGICGDWCHSACVEGAYLSGQAVVGRMLGSLAHAASEEDAGGEWPGRDGVG